MSDRGMIESSSIFLRLAISQHLAPEGWRALPLRLVVGLGLIQHGYAKLSRGADSFIAILHAIGVPFADLLGWATIVVEISGGLLILSGAFVQLAALPMIIVLLVAIFAMHLPNGFSSIKLMSYDATGAHFGQPGYETDLLISPRCWRSALAVPGRSHEIFISAPGKARSSRVDRRQMYLSSGRTA